MESLKQQLENLSIEKVHASVENNPLAQSIIQRAFLWLGIITFIVFATGYFVLYLIKTGNLPVEYNMLFWISAIGGFIIILAVSFLRTSMSYAALAIFTLIFAVFEGVGITGILYTYTSASIVNAFAGAGILFTLLALYGYFTKTDLTRLGVILFLGLITIIILTLINLLVIKSPMFELILSLVTLLLFLGFTAWDLQILKIASLSGDKRVEIMFGISLFLNFINIFISLLRLFGKTEE